MPGCVKVTLTALMVAILNLNHTDFLSSPATKMAGANVSPVCTVAEVRSACEEVKMPRPKPPLGIFIKAADPHSSLAGACALQMPAYKNISGNKKSLLCFLHLFKNGKIIFMQIFLLKPVIN